MPATTTKVIEYSVVVVGHMAGSKSHGSVRLELEDGNRAILAFRQAGEDLPDNNKFVSGDWTIYNCWYRESAFSAVVDLLRNEEPIWFTWTELSSGKTGSSLSARQEPPGEGEHFGHQ